MPTWTCLMNKIMVSSDFKSSVLFNLILNKKKLIFSVLVPINNLSVYFARISLFNAFMKLSIYNQFLDILNVAVIKHFSSCQLLNEPIISMIKSPSSTVQGPPLSQNVIRIQNTPKIHFYQLHKMSKGKWLCLKGNKTSVIRNDFLGSFDFFFRKRSLNSDYYERGSEYLGSYINVDIKFNDVFFRDNLSKASCFWFIDFKCILSRKTDIYL